MKKLIYFLFAASVLTACTDELIPGDQVQSDELIFTATIDNVSTRTAITRATGKVTWEEGDIITVNGVEYVAHPDGANSATATFTKKDEFIRSPYKNEEGNYVASYGNVEEQIYDPEGANCPMSAVSASTELHFTNDCGVLRINVKSEGVTVMRLRTGGFGIICNPGVDITTAQDFYLAMPAGEYKNFRICFYTAGNKTSTKTYNGTLTVVKNEIQPITFDSPLQFVDSHEQMKGKFSISPYDQVQFSPGVLQYQASTGDWRFAADQRTFVGNHPGNSVSAGRESQSSWIDLFGWGATGFNEFCAKPYTATNNNGDYKTRATPSSTERLTIADKTDWGYAYSVANGVTGWYTMSWNEWNYLLYTRPASTVNGVENARFAQTIVEGVNGLILFPDEFEWNSATMGAVPGKINTGDSSWNSTDHTLAQFEAMEAAGIIYMPDTGYLRPDGYQHEGNMGSHWTSTVDGSSSAISLDFDDGNPVSCNTNRRTLCTVRLAKRLPEPAEKTEALNGIFSLSATEKVRFAPGNLQYRASTGSWRFAKDQISYYGQCSGNAITSERENSSEWTDWFGWGATGYNEYGATPYEYSSSNTPYKTVSEPNGDEELTAANKADWGYAYNTVNHTSGWFTMSEGQLLYLINTRPASTVNGTANARYAYLTVCGRKCLALFPDSFTWNSASMGKVPSVINKSDSDWNTTDYSYAQYQAMEAAGVVLLPACGYYNGSFTKVSTYGAYWTRTACSGSKAYTLDFDGSGPRGGCPDSYESNRRDHASVRLVRMTGN